MTILIAVAVKPEPGLHPYVLMGADSLKINVDSNFGEVSRDEDAKKILKINDKLVSVAGRINSEFMDYFLDFIKENDCDINDLSKKSLEYIKDYMSGDDIYDEARIAVYIGSCVNGAPKLAFIEVKKTSLPNHTFQIMEPPVFNSFIPSTAGSVKFPKDDDLWEAFTQRVDKNCVNKNLTCVKRAAKEFLLNAVARYPETCNQNIKFEVLR